jgi:hypothetical protein
MHIKVHLGCAFISECLPSVNGTFGYLRGIPVYPVSEQTHACKIAEIS